MLLNIFLVISQIKDMLIFKVFNFRGPRPKVYFFWGPLFSSVIKKFNFRSFMKNSIAVIAQLFGWLKN